MSKTLINAALALLLLLCPAAALAGDAELDRLVKKADMVLRGKTSAGVFSMEVRTSSFKRAFKIVIWDSSQGGKDRTLMKILGPALWRGNGTLKVGSQLKMFNPRSNHVTVVGSSMLGDSWMGSHFTNDDLVKETRLERHYDKALEKKWAGKDEQGKAVTYYRVRLTPRPTAPVAWGKIVYTLWARDGLILPTSAEYFRKAKGKKANRTLTFSGVKELGGRVVPSVMTMKVARKPGEYTTVTYRALKFDVKIPKSKFTEQALRK